MIAVLIYGVVHTQAIIMLIVTIRELNKYTGFHTTWEIKRVGVYRVFIFKVIKK